MTQQAHIPSRPDWRLVLIVALIGMALMSWRSFFNPGSPPFFADTDDAMRMVEARDLLRGQNWYDLIQHRLNTPYGAEIHFSRLIDLPLALLLGLFTPLLGEAQALIVVGYIWPLSLFVVLLWVSGSLALRLVGPAGVLPALVLPILSPAITFEFTPGRVDHHNVVIILTLAIVWMSIEALRRPRLAIVGGLLSATALAIATEALPAIAAAVSVAGLAWVFDARRAPAMRSFGIAFAAGSALHLAIYRPPSRWLEPACDVISPFFVVVAIGVALAFTIASLVPTPRHAWQRLAILAVLGGAAMGVAVWLYPDCIRGPYAGLDPWLVSNWLANINEAKPFFASVIDLPAYTLSVGLPVLLSIIVVLCRLWRVEQDRLQWLTLLVFILAMALVMLVQVRGARLAIMPIMPAAAWLIVTARNHYLARPRLLPVLGLVASWLAFAGVVLSLAVSQLVQMVPSRAQEVAVSRASKQPCYLPSSFAELAGLPAQAIMTPIDLGAHMLLYTPHAVVAAPYHRAQQGVRDTFHFFNDPIGEARNILDTRGITLVVICPAMPEVGGLASRTPDSFAELFAAGTLPDWLTEVSMPDTPFSVFAVQPR